MQGVSGGSGGEHDTLLEWLASLPAPSPKPEADLKNPWRHIDVSYNFQLHHVPFALEKVLWGKVQLVAAAHSTALWLRRHRAFRNG